MPILGSSNSVANKDMLSHFRMTENQKQCSKDNLDLDN